jgi:hypothetical protein
VIGEPFIFHHRGSQGLPVAGAAGSQFSPTAQGRQIAEKAKEEHENTNWEKRKEQQLVIFSGFVFPPAWGT